VEIQRQGCEAYFWVWYFNNSFLKSLFSSPDPKFQDMHRDVTTYLFDDFFAYYIFVAHV
jgi:hypothetical protein